VRDGHAGLPDRHIFAAHVGGTAGKVRRLLLLHQRIVARHTGPEAALPFFVLFCDRPSGSAVADSNKQHTIGAHARILARRHGGCCRRRLFTSTIPRSLKMTSTMKKMTCRALVVSLLALSFQTANAGLIGADQALAAGAAQTERGLVMSVLNRAETAAQLQAQGVDPTMARQRVAAMTDQ